MLSMKDLKAYMPHIACVLCMVALVALVLMMRCKCGKDASPESFEKRWEVPVGSHRGYEEGILLDAVHSTPSAVAAGQTSENRRLQERFDTEAITMTDVVNDRATSTR